MNPIVLIKDQYLANPHYFKSIIKERGFKDVESGVDGVTYPAICLLDDLKTQFGNALAATIHKDVRVNFLFAREMKLGVKSPNKVHCDSTMGQMSAHLYLSDEWPDGSGTGFFSHEKYGAVERVKNLNIGTANQSMDGWVEYLRILARFNRLAVHKSEYYHCALPVEGFGNSHRSARLVLTCFFDLT